MNTTTLHILLNVFSKVFSTRILGHFLIRMTPDISKYSESEIRKTVSRQLEK